MKTAVVQNKAIALVQTSTVLWAVVHTYAKHLVPNKISPSLVIIINILRLKPNYIWQTVPYIKLVISRQRKWLQERAENSKNPSGKGRNNSIKLTTEEQISTCQNWNAQQKKSLRHRTFYSVEMFLKLSWGNGLFFNFASYHNCHCSVKDEEKCLAISTDSFPEDPETGHDLIPVQIRSF